MATILNGQITIGATRVQGTDTEVSGEFFIKAHPDNTGIVYVGDSEVTTLTGLPLSKSEIFIIKIINLNRLYFIASAADQKIAFICYEQ